jgi:hypothetical protein
MTETKKFESFVERERYLMEFPLYYVDDEARRIKILKWQKDATRVAGAKRINGSPEIIMATGVIESVDRGVWGFGGDSWAVTIDGEVVPSHLVKLAA